MKEKQGIVASVIITAIVVGFIVYLAIPTKIVEKEIIVQPEEELNMERASFVWAVDTWLFSLPMRVAKVLGYFEEENLDVELHSFGQGVNTLDDILAGGAQMGVASHYALGTRLGKGDIGLVSFFVKQRCPTALMTKGDITSIEDLTGRTGANIPGSWWDIIWEYTLAEGGLTREDVDLKSYTSAPDYLASAIRGEIDAAWFMESGLVNAKTQLEPLGWHELVTTMDVMPSEFIDGNGVIAVKKSWAIENPDVVARALRAYNKAAEWVNLNPWEAAAIAEDELGSPREVAYEAIPTYIFYIGIPNGYALQMKETIEWGWESGYIAQRYDLDNEMVAEPLLKVFPESVTYEPLLD